MEASKVHGIAVIGALTAAGTFGLRPPDEGVTNSSSVSSMTEFRRVLAGCGVRVRARWIVSGLNAFGCRVTGGSFLGEATGVRTDCCVMRREAAGREDLGDLTGDGVRFRRVGDVDFTRGSTVVIRRPARAVTVSKLWVTDDFGAAGVLTRSSRSGNSSSSSLAHALVISSLFRFFALAGRGSGLEALFSFQSLTSSLNCAGLEDPAASKAVISTTSSSSSSGKSGVRSGAGFESHPVRKRGDSCCLIGRTEGEPGMRLVRTFQIFAVKRLPTVLEKLTVTLLEASRRRNGSGRQELLLLLRDQRRDPLLLELELACHVVSLGNCAPLPVPLRSIDRCLGVCSGEGGV